MDSANLDHKMELIAYKYDVIWWYENEGFATRHSLTEQVHNIGKQITLFLWKLEEFLFILRAWGKIQ